MYYAGDPKPGWFDLNCSLIEDVPFIAWESVNWSDL